jgi:hypothetical protein
MSENWFRGEGINVQPAKARGVTNDIGDGMYFTDDPDVARQYARERAPNLSEQRVYSVRVERAGMRVLDLTTDVRWRRMMNFPVPSQNADGSWNVNSGETFETKLRKFPASQQYKGAFNSFLENNEINLDDYDAVIGLEYRSGGKQMCILYKGGQPSPLQVQLRAQFRPLGNAPIPASAPGALRLGGKIGPGMKVAGGALVATAITLLLSWILSKIQEQLERESLDRQMEGFRPQIEADIQREKQRFLELLSDGKKSFATLRVSVEKWDLIVVQDPNPSGGSIPSSAKLSYLGLEITDSELNKPDGEEHESVLGAGRRNCYFYKISFPVTFSPEEVDLYKAYQNEIDWYDAQLQTAPSAEDALRLNLERNALIRKLNFALLE